MLRRVFSDERREGLRWALIMLFFAVGSADQPVQRFLEGCYRVGWWVRRSIDRRRGQIVDGITALGNLYFRTAEWTALRYRRLTKKQ